MQASNGQRVGYLNQGTSFVLCQAAGGEVTSGANRNKYWAYTEANNHKFGWVNAVWAHGGSNDAPYGGVPTCPASRGRPPGGAPARPPARRVPALFQRAKHQAFAADPGSQIVRDNIGGDGDDGLIVMRFFIPSKLAAVGCLKGDGRSFDSNPLLSAMFSGHARSRVVLAWDTSTGEVVFKVMESEEHDCDALGYVTRTGRKLAAVPLTRYQDCAAVANDPGVDQARDHQDVFLSTRGSQAGSFAARASSRVHRATTSATSVSSAGIAMLPPTRGASASMRSSVLSFPCDPASSCT